MSDFEYEKKINDWEEAGTEPPAGSRKWITGEEPPAAWFNFFWDGVIKSFANVKTWINGHKQANTGVHGVGTGHIETVEGAQNKVNTAMSTHTNAADPHPGYATDTDLGTHKQANTGVHGVGTGHIETVEGAQGKVNSAISGHLAASNPHSQYYETGKSLTTYAYNGMSTSYAYSVFTNAQTSNLLSIINNLMKAAHKHSCSDNSDNSDDSNYSDSD